jgi:hypothetical protein
MRSLQDSLTRNAECLPEVSRSGNGTEVIQEILLQKTNNGSGRRLSTDCLGAWQGNKSLGLQQFLAFFRLSVCYPLRLMLRACQQLPVTAKPRPFDGAEWLFELKYDGVRALAYLDGAPPIGIAQRPRKCEDCGNDFPLTIRCLNPLCRSRQCDYGRERNPASARVETVRSERRNVPMNEMATVSSVKSDDRGQFPRDPGGVQQEIRLSVACWLRFPVNRNTGTNRGEFLVSISTILLAPPGLFMEA